MTDAFLPLYDELVERHGVTSAVDKSVCRALAKVLASEDPDAGQIEKLLALLPATAKASPQALKVTFVDSPENIAQGGYEAKELRRQVEELQARVREQVATPAPAAEINAPATAATSPRAVPAAAKLRLVDPSPSPFAALAALTSSFAGPGRPAGHTVRRIRSIWSHTGRQAVTDDLDYQRQRLDRWCKRYAELADVVGKANERGQVKRMVRTIRERIIAMEAQMEEKLPWRVLKTFSGYPRGKILTEDEVASFANFDVLDRQKYIDRRPAPHAKVFRPLPPAISVPAAPVDHVGDFARLVQAIVIAENRNWADAEDIAAGRDNNLAMKAQKAFVDEPKMAKSGGFGSGGGNLVPSGVGSSGRRIFDPEAYRARLREIVKPSEVAA